MVSRCGMDDERGDLLTELTTGFEALLEKVEVLAIRNAEFERQLKTYNTEGRAQFTPTRGSFTSSDVGDERESREVDALLENDPRVAKGIQAWELLRLSMTGTVPLRRKRWRKMSPNRTLVGPKPGLERDFTTQGTQGELKCPFSKRVPVIEDPHLNITHQTSGIPPKQQTLHPEQAFSSNQSRDARSKSFSNTGSATQCPIRFLKQLPAEDVAKYFEEHKHEIPRSHEVCVKRYQANEQSIRSLDAKYGNLVNMIQGLGEKHQPMLPSKQELDDDDEAVELDRRSIEKVEKWAENCGDGPGPMDEAIEADDDSDDNRTGHFERPLKEVRLGESPSRPWGIQVPFTDQAALSSNAIEKDSVAPPIQPATQKDTITEDPVKRPAGKCPFGHGAAPSSVKPKSQTVSREPSQSHVKEGPVAFERPQDAMHATSAPQKSGTNPPSFVFNGPVFFGYSAESAAKLMQAFQQQQYASG